MLLLEILKLGRLLQTNTNRYIFPSEMVTEAFMGQKPEGITKR